MVKGKSKTPPKGKKKGAKQTEKKGEEATVEQAPDLLEMNSSRTFALRDLWFEDLVKAVDEQIAPELNKREMLFLTVTNAVLDMVVDVLPEELARVVSENIDDYIAVTLVNKQFGVDLLKEFQDEFVKEKGSEFETEENLDAALSEFQDKFWGTKRKELRDKSPNQAIAAILKKYELS
jgi:hypothetical protein